MLTPKGAEEGGAQNPTAALRDRPAPHLQMRREGSARALPNITGPVGTEQAWSSALFPLTFQEVGRPIECVLLGPGTPYQALLPVIYTQ